MADCHRVIQPNGGLDNPTEGIGAGTQKIVSHEPVVRAAFESFASFPFFDDTIPQREYDVAAAEF